MKSYFNSCYKFTRSSWFPLYSFLFVHPSLVLPWGIIGENSSLCHLLLSRSLVSFLYLCNVTLLYLVISFMLCMDKSPVCMFLLKHCYYFPFPLSPAFEFLSPSFIYTSKEWFWFLALFSTILSLVRIDDKMNSIIIEQWNNKFS